MYLKTTLQSTLLFSQFSLTNISSAPTWCQASLQGICAGGEVLRTVLKCPAAPDKLGTVLNPQPQVVPPHLPSKGPTLQACGPLVQLLPTQPGPSPCLHHLWTTGSQHSALHRRRAPEMLVERLCQRISSPDLSCEVQTWGSNCLFDVSWWMF